MLRKRTGGLFLIRFRAGSLLPVVALHRFVYRAYYKSIYAFALLCGVFFQNVFFSFWKSNIDSIIIVFHIFIHGFLLCLADFSFFLKQFRPEDLSVTLEREPDNRYDRNAICIVVHIRSIRRRTVMVSTLSGLPE